jgi:hypothetical protein
MLATTVRIGQTVTLKHKDHGDLGSLRVEHKTGNAVRLIFDMPRSIIIAVLDHRASGITFGIRGQALAPLKSAFA